MGEPNEPHVYEKDSGVKEALDDVERELKQRDPQAVKRGRSGLSMLSLSAHPDLFEKLKRALREADQQAGRPIPLLEVKVGDWVKIGGDWCTVTSISPWDDGTLYVEHRTDDGGMCSMPINGEALRPEKPPREEFYRQAIAVKRCREYEEEFDKARRNALSHPIPGKYMGDRISEHLSAWRARRKAVHHAECGYAPAVHYKGRVVWREGDELAHAALRARFDRIDELSR